MKRYIRATTLSKQEQFDIIQATNPRRSEINFTWINSIDDIQTFQEAYDNDIDGYVSGGGFTEDYTVEDMAEALRAGKITVYSSHPIENGTFVTPSKMEALLSYGGGQGYMAEVNLDDIAWIDVDQGQVATNKKISYRPVRYR